MIPLRDVIPSRTTPYITITIIALNALAWLFELSLPHDVLNEFLTVYGVVPAYFSAPTLITSMFLHGSWSHVIGNMWYLWIFGDNVEDRVGHGRFIVFYLLCGIAAALGQVAVDPNSTLPTIGASGAIAGVMGAYFVLYPALARADADPVDLPADRRAAGDRAARLLVPDAAVQRRHDRDDDELAAAAASRSRRTSSGFVVGMGGVFLFRKRERDPWEQANYY